MDFLRSKILRQLDAGEVVGMRIQHRTQTWLQWLPPFRYGREVDKPWVLLLGRPFQGIVLVRILLPMCLQHR